MKCFKCGYGLQDGKALFRQNPKGEAGIWACEECNTKPVHEDVALVVADVQSSQKPTLQ